MHAQLGRLLHDEIELLAFDERLRERQLKRRFDSRRRARPNAHRRAALSSLQHDALVFDARPIEDDDAGSRPQPEDAAQMVRLALIESVHALGNGFRRRIEPMQAHTARQSFATLPLV